MPSPKPLDDLPTDGTVFQRAMRMKNVAADFGFDWPDWPPVWQHLLGELDELRAEIEATDPAHEKIVDEFGDVLFVLAVLANHLRVDPDAALDGALIKFKKRFHMMQDILDERGLSRNSDLTVQTACWKEAKERLKSIR